MKLKDLINIFSAYTNVRLITDENICVFVGTWISVSADYLNYVVDNVIPIKYPYNNLTEVSILIHYEDEEQSNDTTK